MVVAHNRIAGILALTGTSKSLPGRVDGCRSRQPVAALVEDGEGDVHHLDVVIGSYGADHVGRREPGGRNAEKVLHHGRLGACARNVLLP